MRYDARRDRYIDAAGKNPEVLRGGLLWQTHLGGRKAGGVYYTPVPLVRHLVRSAVVPSFECHLERVAEEAKTDPVGAAELLLSFSVIDPSCGSAHFLVEVAETLADMTLRFLAQHPLPALVDEIARLRSQTTPSVECDDAVLLRRLIVKHCVYGVEVSPMGAEVATLSLWLASFVPGLSLAYLGRNVQVGDALTGVGDTEPLLDEAPLFRDVLEKAMQEAAEKVLEVTRQQDRTPDEVAKSKKADRQADEATAGLEKLFHLWTAEQFGLKGARSWAVTNGSELISGRMQSKLAQKAVRLAKRYNFFHWPLAFPHLFGRDRPGFDAVVGNPPWEEVTVEELSFYAMYRPGLNAVTERERSRMVADLLRDKPRLEREFLQVKEKVALHRRALKAGDYKPMKGDPDLYKYFCQRYPLLLRNDGHLGVVLPRTAFNTMGSIHFRTWIFLESITRRVDFLVNRGKWMFDTGSSNEVALVVARKSQPDTSHRFQIASKASSQEEWGRQASRPGIRYSVSMLGPGHEVPSVRSQKAANLLDRLRTGNLFPFGAGARWECFAVSELHETINRKLWQQGGDAWLWKGASIEQYSPHGKDARPCPSSLDEQSKVNKQGRGRPGSGSLLASSQPLKVRQKAVLTELGRDRIAFRDVTSATASRTVIACLVPRGVFLTNTAPYLAFPAGDDLARAACLGIMNSLPFDWQARRFVGLHMNFFLLEGLHLPPLGDNDFNEIARAAARLSGVDDRFAEFARATGVEAGPLSEQRRTALRVEIDARVARAWGLSPDDLEVIYADFSDSAVPPAYRSRLSNRFAELG